MRGGGVGGVGGGVKSFCSKGSKQWERLLLPSIRRSNGNTVDTEFLVSGPNPGRLTVGGGSGFTRPGFGPPTKKPLVGCITIRPLLGLEAAVSPLLGAVFATNKNPNCVLLSD